MEELAQILRRGADGRQVEVGARPPGTFRSIPGPGARLSSRKLCEQTRELACKRISVSQEGFHRILHLLESP